MKKILISILAASALFASCSDWTTPENLQYLPDKISESDPEGYAQMLAAIRAYKETDHNVMIVTMEGVSEEPYARPHHITNMPDSADVICVKNAATLHSSLVPEIAEVRQTKGTKCVAFVDYATIDEVWTALEDAKADAGEPAGTIEEAEAFFREQAEIQIAACDAHGFDGIMVSYEGSTISDILAAKQKGFLDAAAAWRNTHSDALLIVRGTISQMSLETYGSMLESSKYLIVAANTVAESETQISTRVRQILGSAPTDRAILEVSVPSVDAPKQVGPSAAFAAQWVLNQKNNRYYTPVGLCVGNASDDYYRQEMIYLNVRRAISIMNPAPAEAEE